MSNWGNGYKEGYRDAVKKVFAEYQEFPDNTAKEFMDSINKDNDGSPSQYAVANKCCGGVDAHDVNCRR